MGGSGWDYFTPYRADIAQALNELRQRIFESKNYGNSIFMPDSLELFDTLLQEAKPEDRTRIEADRARHAAAIDAYAAERRRLSEPKTIEEALKQSETEGTHSILDICRGISDGPDWATAFPMPVDVLMRLFGTTRPTRKQIEKRKHAMSRYLKTWQCWYVIVYRDDQPDEIYFEGLSGD